MANIYDCRDEGECLRDEERAARALVLSVPVGLVLWALLGALACKILGVW